MFRFIHSSDLHLGKRFGNFSGDLPSRLREARHAVLSRLAQHAREQGVTTILLAGDTFDTETPAPDVRRQALAEMRRHAPIRWVILPGNHDSLQATQLWSALKTESPENVLLAVDARPLALAEGVFLLPAPCTTRRPGRDLTEWMDKEATPEGAIRIGLAHGPIQSFSEDSAATDVIAPDRARRAGLDYMALGDWHGALEIDARTRYSGAPEPDRFKHDRAGEALLVRIAERSALAALRSEYAARSSTVANPLENDDDIETVRAAVTDAASRCRSARQALREVEPLQRLADDAFIRAESALARLQAEKAQIDAILGAEPDREARERHMSEELRALQGKVADAQAQAEAVRASAIDLASAEAALKRARSVDQAAGQEVNKLREEIAGLNATISARCDEAVEERWRETTEALSAAEIRVRQFAREAAALQTLQSALESARSQARELYLKPVMTELKPLLELLFEDVSITFDEKTLLPQTILRRGLEEQVDRLSGGMKEQLSVLTRLAFARLLAKDGRSTPVILDDALVYSDDDRIEKMFDALHRQSRDQQIIVFSCRQRAFQKLGGNVLEMTDWLPSQ